MSFSLYLLHWPLLKLVHMAGLTAGNNPLAFAAIIAGVVAVSGAFATVTEHKRYAVRAWIERVLCQRPAVTSAA
jgi:peptidoglycan/LPS O-acetylase OafA/YrhL